MESSSDYKILRFCLLKEEPKTNFILVNKINTVDDNDYNVILSMSNEIYIKLHKRLKVLSLHNSYSTNPTPYSCTYYIACLHKCNINSENNNAGDNRLI
jgi:hypothetical protein